MKDRKFEFGDRVLIRSSGVRIGVSTINAEDPISGHVHTWSERFKPDGTNVSRHAAHLTISHATEEDEAIEADVQARERLRGLMDRAKTHQILAAIEAIEAIEVTTEKEQT